MPLDLQMRQMCRRCHDISADLLAHYVPHSTASNRQSIAFLFTLYIFQERLVHHRIRSRCFRKFRAFRHISCNVIYFIDLPDMSCVRCSIITVIMKSLLYPNTFDRCAIFCCHVASIFDSHHHAHLPFISQLPANE